MQTLDGNSLSSSNVYSKIINYFQRFFKNNKVNTDTRIIDLGFESLDYIELAAFLLKTTGLWLNISKINNNTRISDISSCLFKLEQEKPGDTKKVRLDEYQRYVYADELNNKNCNDAIFIVHYLCLKKDVDIPQLKHAIAKTLTNHFILNSKLVRINDDYYFENTPTQSDFTFKRSLLFPKKNLAKLIINVYSDRLVNIYTQRKWKHHYLIITFHHIALDGWSYKIIVEEIFRRYAGLYKDAKKSATEDIPALNSIYMASINEPSNTNELKTLLKPVDPCQYNHLDHLFDGKRELNYSAFVITKEELDHYAQMSDINNFPYSVVFAFMFHQMLRKASGVNKLLFDVGLSNRNLPINGINQLVSNFVNGLPLFLNNENLNSREFATKINETLKIYFKHMSYGALTRILLENDTLLNVFMSPYHRPYSILFNYTNNISQMIYGNNSITSNYINWNKSKTNVCNKKDSKCLFFDIYNLGTEFLVEIHSRAVKNFHQKMINNFLKIHFPNVPL